LIVVMKGWAQPANDFPGCDEPLASAGSGYTIPAGRHLATGRQSLERGEAGSGWPLLSLARLTPVRPARVLGGLQQGFIYPLNYNYQ
jgi:hypothetical protein